MKVQKRGSRGYEEVQFDKITERVRHLCNGLSPMVDPISVAMRTIQNLYDGISTEYLDQISAKIAESFKLIHPDYSTLAARIMVSNLHKTTPKKFSECMGIIRRELPDITSDRHYDFIAANAAAIDNMIVDDNDYLFDYFGYKTLENAYLIKITEKVTGADGKPVYTDRAGRVVPSDKVEFTSTGVALHAGQSTQLMPKLRDRVMDRPQYVFMRVAIAIYIDSDTNINAVLENIKQCYKAMSQMYFTHATPTLFNACARNQQLSSCFLLGTQDSIEGIMKTITDVSLISKRAGGVGVHASNIRCRNSRIKGTNGKSSGLPKQLKIYNEIARCWDQGGKRLGAIAIYLEPWHGDIMQFLEMKLNQGDDNERARDLFYALWVPDLFVKKVFAESPDEREWLLFSEDTAPGLSAVYDGMDVCTKCGFCVNPSFGEFITKCTEPCASQHEFEPRDAFTELYTRYSGEGRAVGSIDARKIMDAMCEMQRESGTPYVCFKDHVNRMSNQKNIGTIKSSNLCAEIMEYSSDTSYATCNLASINLKKFLVASDAGLVIDYAKLHDVTRMIIRNLNAVIDINHYPTPECAENTRNYRPVALGIQALADVFVAMRIPYLSDKAGKIDLEIAETMYHAAITESCELAKKYGAYPAFAGSPASNGKLRFDLWKENQRRIGGPLKDVNPLSGRYDWPALAENVKKHGLRMSLHLANMPTVTTSQIMGNNESFEPCAANIYTKNTLAGKFTLSSSAMVRHLMELGLWNESMKNAIINAGGSIQDIESIPQEVKDIYKTVWEMKQVDLMRRAALRYAFVDQSQSFNVHTRDNSNPVLRGIFRAGWQFGSPTGSYYIRSEAAVAPMRNNIAASKATLSAPTLVTSAPTLVTSAPTSTAVCRRDAGCTSCGS